MGLGWNRCKDDFPLNVCIHSLLFSGSIRKPRSISMFWFSDFLAVCPVTCSMAWSDAKLPSQSRVKSENVAACIATSLYHARSITESHSWFAPLLVISLWMFTRVRRFITAHSLSQFAHFDWGMSWGDHSRACVLKSPITRVGVVASMSISRSFWRHILSRIS